MRRVACTAMIGMREASEMQSDGKRGQLESMPYCCVYGTWLGNGLRKFIGQAILHAAIVLWLGKIMIPYRIKD
jgi:hypothetical protein